MTIAPSAVSTMPTLSGQAASALDDIVGKWVRDRLASRPSWNEFLQRRNTVRTMRVQLEQFAYVEAALDEFVSFPTPADLEGAGGVCTTRAQVLRAFGQKTSEWGEVCSETLALTKLYGLNGERGADARVVGMLDEPAAVTIGMQSKKFLDVLRKVHHEWEETHPGMG